MRASMIALLAAGLGAIACGTTAPSRELMNARDAYDRARMSEAAQYAPDSVLGAKQALQAAERQHQEEPQSATEKSYAYVAQRRAELAMVAGAMARERAQRAQAEQDYVALQDEIRKR